MERYREMWKAVEKEHGELSHRELFTTLTALKWADKTMIEKAYEYAEAKYDLDYCGNVRDVLNYLKSLTKE